MATKTDQPVLTKEEHDKLVSVCSRVATDPERMYAAIERMLRSANVPDRQAMKIWLELSPRSE